MKLRVAILGATSFVAQGLIYYFLKNDNRYSLSLLSRHPSDIKWPVTKNSLTYFDYEYYDVLINCINPWDENSPDSLEFFDVSEYYEDRIIDYLKGTKDSLYINFSSGAVYGKFDNVINENSCAIFNNSPFGFKDNYAINKLYIENKHRSLQELNIVDIRLFGYFSRWINPNSHYLLAHVVRALKDGGELVTDGCNIIRDYVIPEDLFQLIELCIKKRDINDFFDTYSLYPVAKFDLLDDFVRRYGLKYKIKSRADYHTNIKWNYYSTSKKAEKVLGYVPKYTSISGIIEEIENGL